MKSGDLLKINQTTYAYLDGEILGMLSPFNNAIYIKTIYNHYKFYKCYVILSKYGICDIRPDCAEKIL
jgi:hypothetical protein